MEIEVKNDGDVLPNVKRGYHFRKKAISDSQDQLVWEESSRWRVDEEGLQLTHLWNRCYGDEEHYLEGEKL